ncbi:MAG: class C sortase [Bifidobacteriaceae bacterium]|jgi:sortase A|nr:class C sortase [Bifidobacteriaceae bacterium]
MNDRNNREKHAVDTPGIIARPRRVWKPDWFVIAITLLVLLGLLLILYPTAASWISQYNQSEIVNRYPQAVETAEPSAATQLQRARAYNRKLISSASLASDATVPQSDSASDSTDYDSQLRIDDSGLMGRLKISSIDVDVPIYHGTAEETLRRGIGHLEGTSLPVGGVGTRSVLTGHRGLSSSTLFTHLDKVAQGDLVTLEILDEVLTYKVTQIQVVEPDETQALRPLEGKDLLTLVTCTPLGINSQRILVTGERISPTPRSEIEAAGAPSTIPGFAWWALAAGLGLVAAAVVIWRSGYRKVW